MTSSLVAALDADRAWLTNPSASYVANLDLLPAPVLRAAAQRIGCKRSDARLKSLSIKALVSHFEIRWTELSYQSIDMLSRRLTIPLPSVCLQTRVILIAAVVEDTYGIDVAAALHPPPLLLASANALGAVSPATAVNTPLWIGIQVDELARCLEQLPRSDIHSCIQWLPHLHHSLYTSCSHRKSCNALANTIRLRVLYLHDCSIDHMVELYLACCNFPSSCSITHLTALNDILKQEFRPSIIERLMQEVPSISDRCKIIRAKTKLSVLDAK